MRSKMHNHSIIRLVLLVFEDSLPGGFLLEDAAFLLTVFRLVPVFLVLVFLGPVLLERALEDERDRLLPVLVDLVLFFSGIGYSDYLLQ